MTGLVVDLVVAALLAATCVYCFILNRRLSAVRDGQASLEAAIAAFDAAAQRAEASLHRIEIEGAITGRELSAAIERAESLASDLSVMAASGERVAQRLDDALQSLRVAGAVR